MAAKEISVKKYVVRLSGEERERLEVMLRKGKSPARQLLKERILLKADVSDAGEAWSDSRIIEALGTGPSMVYRVRKRLVEEGFEAALSRKQRVTPAVHADIRRRERSRTDRPGLFATAQGTSALDLAFVRGEGRRTRDCRSRQRQHDRAGARTNVLQPHRRQCWVIPPKANSAFVAAMEDVLAVYTRPHDPDCPLVCLDETSKQLLAETRSPIPMKAANPARLDYEYERNGTANMFMMFAPLEGRRHVKVTAPHGSGLRRCRADLVDVHFRARDDRPGPGQSQHP